MLYLSFHQWNPFGANPYPVFIGADNFRRLVFDSEFLLSIWVTLKFAFFAVFSEIVIGYLLAQLFMREFPGRGFFRTIHTLPLIVAPIVVGSVWRLMTTPSRRHHPLLPERLVRHRPQHRPRRRRRLRA